VAELRSTAPEVVVIVMIVWLVILSSEGVTVDGGLESELVIAASDALEDPVTSGFVVFASGIGIIEGAGAEEPITFPVSVLSPPPPEVVVIVIVVWFVTVRSEVVIGLIGTAASGTISDGPDALEEPVTCVLITPDSGAFDIAIPPLKSGVVVIELVMVFPEADPVAVSLVLNILEFVLDSVEFMETTDGRRVGSMAVAEEDVFDSNAVIGFRIPIPAVDSIPVNTVELTV